MRSHHVPSTAAREQAAFEREQSRLKLERFWKHRRENPDMEIPELVELFGVSDKTVARWIKKGENTSSGG